MNHANLLAYTRWHARDAVLRCLAPALFFTIIVAFPLAELASRAGLDSVRVPGDAQDQVYALYSSLLVVTMTLGALLVASGFIAKDRESGHVRFLFSAPVVPWKFYLLRFLVGLAFLCAVYALIPLGFGWLVIPVAVTPAVKSAALYGFLFGSVAMLSGALTRHDGALVVVTSLVGFTLQQVVRAASGNAPAWMTWMSRALPPIDTADRIRSAWLAGGTADSRQLTLVLAWSVAMLLASLYIIRRRPLVR